MRVRPDAEATVVVLAGGDPLPHGLLADVAAAIDAATLTVAADGGLHHAQRAGRTVDVLVGDLDSVDLDALERARAGGTEVIVHPPDKDATDLALALELVLARVTGEGPVPVLVVGGHGGRTDHLVGNLLLLASDRNARLRITAWWGEETVHIVRGAVTLHGEPDATVSLLALNGPARGVTTTGLRFALEDATLDAGSPLGISNRLAAATATVTVRSGVLGVVQSPPEPRTGHRATPRTALGTEGGR